MPPAHNRRGMAKQGWGQKNSIPTFQFFSRTAGGVNVQWADGGETTGEYKPWMDVNNQPLPRAGWSPFSYGYPWRADAFSNTSMLPALLNRADITAEAFASGGTFAAFAASKKGRRTSPGSVATNMC